MLPQAGIRKEKLLKLIQHKHRHTVTLLRRSQHRPHRRQRITQLPRPRNPQRRRQLTRPIAINPHHRHHHIPITNRLIVQRWNQPRIHQRAFAHTRRPVQHDQLAIISPNPLQQIPHIIAPPCLFDFRRQRFGIVVTTIGLDRLKPPCPDERP